MKRIAPRIATICFLMTLFALTGVSPSHAADTFNPLCEKDSPFLCWRDPSDGGPGTHVVNSSYGFDNARLWDRMKDTSRCGGNVSNSNACPFTPGSGLNTQFNGDRIVIVKNAGSGYCAGSSLADSGDLYMHSCDGINGVSELATVFVEQPFTDHYRLISVLYTNNSYAVGNPATEYINGTNTNDGYVFIEIPGTWARWTGA